MATFDSIPEEYFISFAENEKERNEKKSFIPREYENAKYSGLETSVNKFYRLLGAPIGAEKAKTGYIRKPQDPAEVIVCNIKDDDDKRMVLRLPLKTDHAATDHPLHRMYAKITEVDWSKDKVTGKSIKTNRWETKYPDLWEKFTKGNFSPKDGISYTYSTGLKGKQYVIYNVIDRNDDWCKENKHTKILSKQVNIVDGKNGDPIEFADPGVPSSGFLSEIAKLTGKYRSYLDYDVAIKRTGQKNTPYEIRNASVLKEKDLLEDISNDDGSEVNPDLIVVGPLTEEEKNYSFYNIQKLAQPTSATRILKKMSSYVKLFDAHFGTKYEQELMSLAEKEKAEWEKMYGTKEEQNAEVESSLSKIENEVIQEQIQSEDPIIAQDFPPEPIKKSTRRSAIGPIPTNLSPEQIALLKGWSELTEEQRLLIQDVKKEGDKIVISYKEEAGNTCACDNCGTESPLTFLSCPVCGALFEE